MGGSSNPAEADCPADGRRDRLFSSKREYTSITVAARCLAFRWADRVHRR